jgi:hypothetical protein
VIHRRQLTLAFEQHLHDHTLRAAEVPAVRFDGSRPG